MKIEFDGTLIQLLTPTKREPNPKSSYYQFDKGFNCAVEILQENIAFILEEAGKDSDSN